MPRFVLLEHDHPQLHWDLMLEAGDALRTWRLVEPPRIGTSVQAEASFPHRVYYLDYEGPISKNRGSVTRRDWGEFAWEMDTKDVAAVRVHGQRMAGLLRLERHQGDTWIVTLSSPPDLESPG